MEASFVRNLSDDARHSPAHDEYERSWDRDREGALHPNLHAKAMGADGRVCAIGSANMDVTGSFWEGELLLVVEDDAVARAFEERIDTLVSSSVRVDRDDPAWQRTTARRHEWMHSWPGVLSP